MAKHGHKSLFASYARISSRSRSVERQEPQPEEYREAIPNACQTFSIVPHTGVVIGGRSMSDLVPALNGSSISMNNKYTMVTTSSEAAANSWRRH
jgi:hypothetical protein